MLEPTSPPPVALLDAVADLRRTAAALAAPPIALDGWASLAAVDYERAALRIVRGIEEVRSALAQASAALAVP
jgi:hypothetical protein